MELSSLSMDFCPLQGVSPLLSPAAILSLIHDQTWLSALFLLPGHCSHPTISNLQGRRCLQSGVNGLNLRAWIHWAETSCSEGSSLDYVRPQWRFHQSFTFPGASQSDQVHPQPLHMGAAPQSIHTFARQGHPCCLLCPWRGTVGSPISGEVCSPPWPDLGSGLWYPRRVAPVSCGVASSLLSCSLTSSGVFLLFRINSVICTQSCGSRSGSCTTVFLT